MTVLLCFKQTSIAILTRLLMRYFYFVVCMV